MYNKIKNITTEKNIELTAQINQSMQDAINIITAKNGKDFDNAYLNWLIQDSKSTIKNLETAGATQTDQALKQYALTSIPTIKKI